MESGGGHRLNWLGRHPTAAIATGGVLSAALYGVLHLTQHALLSPGLAPVEPTTSVWDDPANAAQLGMLLGGYALAVFGLLVVYDRVIQLARTTPATPARRGLLFGWPVLLVLGALLSTAYFSTDLYSYAAYGYIGTLPAGNAYYQEARTILATPFGEQLVAFGWRGAALSPYGPLWNALASGAVRLGQDASQAVFVLKLLVGLALLGSAAAAYVVLGQTRPADQVAGTAAVLWQPALVVLVAAEGHNEGLLLLLVLGSLALTVRQHVVGGTVVQALAVMTKYVPGLLWPLQAAYWWWTTPDRRRLGLQLALGLALGALVAALLYAPVWLGASTFLGTGALGSGEPVAQRFDLLGLSVLFARVTVIGVAIAVGMLRARTGAALVEACALVTLLAVLVGPQRFWPWYAAVPLGLLALTPRGLARWLGLVFAACVLLASPIEALPIDGTGPIGFEAQTLVFRLVRVVPLVALGGLGLWTWWRGRWNPTAIARACRRFSIDSARRAVTIRHRSS